MLIAPTVKIFLVFLVGAGNPAEIWTFPNLFQRWSVDLFAAVYLTKNVKMKISSSPNLRKSFFEIFSIAPFDTKSGGKSPKIASFPRAATRSVSAKMMHADEKGGSWGLQKG
jgi:hypothetical protein